MILSEEAITYIMKLVVDAGNAIMEVYNGNFSVEYKGDSSPITDADRKAHDIICNGLRAFPLKYPIISEESEYPKMNERQLWTEYWLIDPLDGTKEFVHKNGEFAINVALIRREIHKNSTLPYWMPVFGLVYLPAKDIAYVGWVYGEEEDILLGNAYQVNNMSTTYTYWREDTYKISPLVSYNHNTSVRVVMSRNHVNEKTKEFIHNIQKNINKVEEVPMGSCIKMCKIASGYAHVYPRFAPTMEWDTAAAHAICRAVGVSVLNVHTGMSLYYNKETLENPGFIVTAIQTFKDMLCDRIN